MSDYGNTPPPPPPPSYGASGVPGGAEGAPPQNYLVWAILTTIFCCLPLGVVSIVFAAQVNGKWAQGDVAGARGASAKARTFAMWAAIAGIVWLVIWGIVIAAGGGSFNFNTGTN